MSLLSYIFQSRQGTASVERWRKEGGRMPLSVYPPWCHSVLLVQPSSRSTHLWWWPGAAVLWRVDIHSAPNNYTDTHTPRPPLGWTYSLAHKQQSKVEGGLYCILYWYVQQFYRIGTGSHAIINGSKRGTIYSTFHTGLSCQAMGLHRCLLPPVWTLSKHPSGSG